MSWSKAIGGYFELELNDFGSIYHDNLIKLNSGRNALEYILIQEGYEKVYVPYYTCDVILQPLRRQNIDYAFYLLDEAFYPKDIVLKENEALLYVNYFGIMNIQVKHLSKIYSNLIIDNSQAFYEKPIEGIDTFYSPRKFFGLPDGGLASCRINREMNLERDSSLNRMSHLLTRIEKDPEKGYNQFKTNDKKIDNLPIKKMSRLTEKLMRNIWYENVRDRRNTNFKEIHRLIRMENELTPLIDNSLNEAPLVYPFLKEGNLTRRNKLIENKIYTATYWPNVKEWLKGNNYWETYLQENLISLPVDQRYETVEIAEILSVW